MTETHEQRVERLARAVCVADPHAPDPDAAILWGMKECRAWEARVPLARAIIASDREAGMVTVPREPSEAMRHAGGMVLDPGARMEGPNAASRQKAARVYEAAIAAHEQEERQDAP